MTPNKTENYPIQLAVWQDQELAELADAIHIQDKTNRVESTINFRLDLAIYHGARIIAATNPE